MPTYDAVREYVKEMFGTTTARLSESNTAKGGFHFQQLCYQLHDEINYEEMKRGYTPDYHRPGLPCLCQMELLTLEQLEAWKKKIDDAHEKLGEEIKAGKPLPRWYQEMLYQYPL